MNRKQGYLDNFFGSDGKTVILPIDHGTAIPVPGLNDVGGLIEAVKPHVDGFVVNLGVANAFASALDGCGVCLRTDVYKPTFGDNEDLGSFPVYSMNDALECGAHGVMNMLYTHHPREADIYRDCASLISQGMEVEIPVIVEALPFGIGRPDDYTPENIGFCVRVAAELGADVVKTAYPGDKAAFAEIVQSCFVPVIVLGGATSDDPGSVLSMVEDAIEAGAAGVAIGRNVWGAADPVAMARSLAEIVHG